MNTTLFILSAVLLIGFVFLLVLVRTVTRMRGVRENLTREGGSEVGFVVTTFQDLVARLKEKEKEIEALRQQAEQRADFSEAYNTYILQSVPSGVISLDRDLMVTLVNQAAERILGVSAVDCIGKNAYTVFPEPLRGILGKNPVAGRRECSCVTASGKTIHLGFTLTPLLDARREPIGQLFVFTDLTELKALESQAELRDRLSSLGEMAAGMAHELRNPMGVIAGYTKLLSKKTDPASSHIVEAIANEISVMDRIITDFLSFARPAEPSLALLDPAALIRHCLMSCTAGREDIIVRSDFKEPLELYGDEVLLRQAFTNIIRNAVEAMPRGGTLKVECTPGRRTVEVEVSDTGHGIPEQIRDKIFLPFYTTKDRGTGLGLAIVHQIIVSHKGTISVESSENSTTFRVRLPSGAAA